MKTIVNAKIITQDEVLEGYALSFDEKIVALSQDVPENTELMDAQGLYLSAGFIDIHIHGSNGYDVMDGTEEALAEMSKSILQTGTTSFLATTMTMSKEDIYCALLNVQNFEQKSGAKILGVHLEGPFINVAKKGAQNDKYVQKPNMELILPFMDIVKMITLAPEVDGAREFIEYLSKEYPHVLLSVGHSNASYEECKESFSWGVSHATHLFNAMNPLHHREPGIVGAVLEADEVSFDVIADLIHIHPSFFNLLTKLKKEQLILITDAMRAGCLHCGVSDIGGQKVIVKDGEARLEDGTLAGSVLKMNEALKNFYEHTDISLPELLATVTTIPAKKLGLNKGLIEKGFEADFVLFNEAFEISEVYVDGDIVFQC
ncbi:MAG: N-acetylglucosamine-6-phosphate deacetylase (EC [uncultured Sulfurovum sp.]|uniref:N-acetylglucosamine-6-phosphate deacetylase (EC) n=1 Tax=uncultured Sulfurovum sp. TaxID=269237 RepID=A0A6S6TDE7_9BACT|nr:MAG: N-acetylglucosamine-6-phosphate deacetylase (EC [uncultured Sulfurovum sp.]